MAFALHPQLAADSIFIGDLPLSQLMLMNNSAFPWLILVPRKASARELFELSADDYSMVMQEIRMVAGKFAEFSAADKMNVAALGNIVPQLHIHIIARFKTDAAWPNPVWNSGIQRSQYSNETATKMTLQLRSLFALNNITKM